MYVFIFFLKYMEYTISLIIRSSLFLLCFQFAGLAKMFSRASVFIPPGASHQSDSRSLALCSSVCRTVDRICALGFEIRSFVSCWVHASRLVGVVQSSWKMDLSGDRTSYAECDDATWTHGAHFSNSNSSSIFVFHLPFTRAVLSRNNTSSVTDRL
jgi:hypothetical protein